MNRKFKIVSLLVVIFMFINVTIYSIIEINKKQRIDASIARHLDKLQTHYEILLHHQTITANAAYKSLSLMPGVLDVLSKAQVASAEEKGVLRDKFYKRLKYKYDTLKLKGVVHFGFILPSGEVFLRLQKPERFGDNVKDFRYNVKYVNEFKKQIHGYSKGKIAPAFRNTYPIFSNDKKYLGSVELSFSSENIHSYLENVSKIHTHFLIKKDILNAVVWDKDKVVSNYIDSAEHPEYMMIINKEHKKERYKENLKAIKHIKQEIDDNMNKKKKFGLYILTNNKAVVISFYPIRNIQEETVSWIVSYDRDSFIDMTIKINLMIQTLLFFVFLILFYFIYRVINQKEILDLQVKSRTKELQSSKNELLKLNESLEDRVKDVIAQNQQKEQLLYQQSKMASMGEMIGNIAHQWRQPIAIISMWANNIKMDIDMDEVNNKNFEKYADNINKQTKHLSQTIDDFRNFFAPNKSKSTFTIKSSIDKTMSLLKASFKTHDIEVIENIQNIEISTLENELTQAILNIIKNAKDILITLPKSAKKLIFIKIYLKNNKVIIEIKDNGGGIEEDIINKVFEPYFTTKHKSIGTGIGLYMTQSIITKHLDGDISVKNVEYEHEGEKYLGAEFRIALNLNEDTLKT